MFDIHDKTTMQEALEIAGVGQHEETPQEAAERIWEETGRNPVETMRLFEEWVRGDLAKDHPVFLILGKYWSRLLRTWLEREGQWKYWHTFDDKLRRWEKQEWADKAKNRRARTRITADARLKARNYEVVAERKYRDRIDRGVKSVRAEVDVKTGRVVTLIDKEYGPFKHISINGLAVPECTTEEVLAYCDAKSKDDRFLRALCHQIPDPRIPIGEQWTPKIIRKAREIAERGNGPD